MSGSRFFDNAWERYPQVSTIVKIGWLYHRLGYSIEQAHEDAEEIRKGCRSWEEVLDILKRDYETTLRAELSRLSRL